MKKRLNLMIFTVLMVMILFAGCASWTPAPSVCDNPPGKSYLCEIANKYNVRLEYIGDTLIVLNSANIGLLKLYTVEKALDVMREIRFILDSPISYAALKLQIEERLQDYPGMINVARKFIDELGSRFEPVFEFDRKMLIKWLDEQIAELSLKGVQS